MGLLTKQAKKRILRRLNRKLEADKAVQPANMVASILGELTSEIAELMRKHAEVNNTKTASDEVGIILHS